MKNNSCSLINDCLEYKSKQDIDSESKILDFLNITWENKSIIKQKIQINSEVFLSLLSNTSSDIINFVDEMKKLKSKNESKESLIEIWKHFWKKIDHLFFLYNKVDEFIDFVTTYDEEWDVEFESILEFIEENYISESIIIYSNIVNIIYYL